LETKNPQN